MILNSLVFRKDADDIVVGRLRNNDKEIFPGNDETAFT